MEFEVRKRGIVSSQRAPGRTCLHSWFRGGSRDAFSALALEANFTELCSDVDGFSLLICSCAFGWKAVTWPFCPGERSQATRTVGIVRIVRSILGVSSCQTSIRPVIQLQTSRPQCWVVARQLVGSFGTCGRGQVKRVLRVDQWPQCGFRFWRTRDFRSSVFLGKSIFSPWHEEYVLSKPDLIFYRPDWSPFRRTVCLLALFDRQILPDVLQT